jgi:hypothetical protein
MALNAAAHGCEEDVQRAIERVRVHAADVAREGVEGAAHVDGSRGHEHPRAGAEGQHGATAVMTRCKVAASKSASTSTMTAPTRRRTPVPADCLGGGVGTSSPRRSAVGASALRAKLSRKT